VGMCMCIAGRRDNLGSRVSGELAAQLFWATENSFWIVAMTNPHFIGPCGRERYNTIT
jgi:hypothetical protein